MRIVVSSKNLNVLVSAEKKARVLASGKWRTEAFRGVVDAGRRTKTQVQRAVHKQMATKQYGFVSGNTRGTPRQAALAYEIYALKGGQKVEIYKGLRALASGGLVAAKFNAGRAGSDAGFVRSGVWNAPRTFKRSFASNGGYFAMLPGGKAGPAPKALWTYGHKPNQPRTAAGRFAPSGQKYGRIRRLFGPALRDEIGKDQSLATFMRVGPALLEQKVMARMVKLMTF